MEFKIPTGKLQTIISKLSNIVKMNENDISGMLYIEADDNIKFKATNGFVHITIDSNECEIIEKGKVLLKFRDIKGYVLRFVPLSENYGTKNFHFIIKNDEGNIKTKTLFPNSKPSYKTLKFEIFNTTQYPIIKPFGEVQLIINSNILKRGIEKVLHCIDPTEIRNALKGLNVTIDEDKIVFVGTNGVKLAEDTMNINADIRQASYIFKHDLATILRFILDDDSQVFISFEGRYVYIKCNDIYIIGSLIIGESYPDYKPMFACNETIIFPRVDFTDSILAIMDVLDPEDNNRLTLNFNSNKLTLKNDRVEAVHEFDNNFNSVLDVDVNGVFLASMLKDFIGDNLEIHFTKGNNYITFKSENDSNHIALITTVKRR